MALPKGSAPMLKSVGDMLAEAMLAFPTCPALKAQARFNQELLDSCDASDRFANLLAATKAAKAKLGSEGP
eukprot:10370357-Heterocapsa_arctica.AAC.1